MALSTHMLRAFVSLAKPGMQIASCGYPDIMCPISDIRELIGNKADGLKYRLDSDALVKWHGGERRKVPTAESLFSALGCELTVYDIAEHRGGEVIRDLNYGLKQSDLEQYDFVLDVGTLEHCFNIAQAAFNMAGLLKEGGIILHENPFNWGNHGFYNLNPTWYHDFYAVNGFEILDMQMVTKDGSRVKGLLHTARFGFTQAEANMCVAARRTKVLPLTFPTQTKYAKLIDATQQKVRHG